MKQTTSILKPTKGDWNDVKMQCLYVALRDTPKTKKSDRIEELTKNFNKLISGLIASNPEQEYILKSYYVDVEELRMKLHQDCEIVRAREAMK